MLRELLGSSREARQRHNQQFFKDNIRRYNAAMAFASFGDPGGVSAARPSGTGPPVYVLHGQPYHSISTLFPSDGRDPAYGQLYIYDPEEATARRNAWDQGLRKDTLFGLHRMMLNLDGQGLHNPYVLGYKHLHEKIREDALSGHAPVGIWDVREVLGSRFEVRRFQDLK